MGFSGIQKIKIRTHRRSDMVFKSLFFAWACLSFPTFASSVFSGKVEVIDNQEQYSAERLIEQAEAGIGKAELELGIAYLYGYGELSQNYEKAIYWLKKAEKSGFQGANRYLGDIYFNGWGVAIDRKKALEHYKIIATLGAVDVAEKLMEIAKSGDTYAQYIVGYLYEIGRYSRVLGRKCDYLNASKWYFIARESGSDDAKAALDRIGKKCFLKKPPVDQCCDAFFWPEGNSKTPMPHHKSKTPTN
jgi:TPR repeat protein